MIGRADKLENLNQNYLSSKNNLTILYGRHGIGKTTLIKEFVKNKKYFYYEALSGDMFEQINLLSLTTGIVADDFESIFEALYKSGVDVFVIEEFHQFVKNGPEFMDAINMILNNHSKIMVVLGCSSVSWVENSMVKAIGKAAFSINTFMKLKELSYSDIVLNFPQSESDTLLKVYGITGGNPEYISAWDGSKSVKCNVCSLFLDRNGTYYNEALNFVKDEFREIGVYNSILSCLAAGKNKLNEIHEYTGYGRDKISVYLKNLINREIVEKIFSYDLQGSENTRKGLYRIKDGFLDFWYKFIYPHKGVLAISEPEEFYDKYLEGKMDEFFKNAFIKIAGEMIEIMNDMDRLPFHVERKGSWYGKNGDIHLIFEDEDGYAIVGQIFTKKEQVEQSDVETLMSNVNLAGINVRQYYLFAVGGFDPGIATDNITMIGINEL